MVSYDESRPRRREHRPSGSPTAAMGRRSTLILPLRSLLLFYSYSTLILPLRSRSRSLSHYSPAHSRVAEGGWAAVHQLLLTYLSANICDAAPYLLTHSPYLLRVAEDATGRRRARRIAGIIEWCPMAADTFSLTYLPTI